MVNSMGRALCLALLMSASIYARADIITTSSLHTGGFYADGGADNFIEHQNYFVGYGTTPGFGRTAERRSFFWYHVPTFTGEVVDATIKLKMLFSTSLIFGLGPTPPIHDPTETFQLGFTTAPAPLITSPTLTTPEKLAIFGSLDDHPIASPYEFSMTTTYEFPFVVEIHLDSVGKALISDHRGGDVVLSGWMPSWSLDMRTDPLTGKFLEEDELLFGFSDVPTLVPAPELTIVTAVPEPSTLLMVLAGAGGLAPRRWRLSGSRSKVSQPELPKGADRVANASTFDQAQE